MAKRKVVAQNKNAIVRSRTTRNGKFRTETARRDSDTLNAAAVTTPQTNNTVLYIDFPVGGTLASVALNGHEARTLYRVLERHYVESGKSIGF